MKLSIIIPCFNEEKTIATIVDQVLGLEVAGWQTEVIVVDDASTDGTIDALAPFRSRIKVLGLSKNSGKGTAVALGLKEAMGDFLVIQDADLEYAPTEIPKLLAAIKDDRSVIYGSRNLTPDRRGGLIPRLGVWFITKLINVLYGAKLTDAWTGYKLFPQAIKSWFTAGRFESELMFTIKALREGYDIDEVPIKYFPRPADQGKKIRYRDGFQSIALIIFDRLRHPPKLLQSVYFKLFVVGLVGLWLGVIWLMPPSFQGDTESYLEAMRVLGGETIPVDFVPNRLLTTFAPVVLIGWLGNIFGNLFLAWFIFNSVLYGVSSVAIYFILRRLFLDERIALLGGLFFAGSYGILHFGTNYLMDIGGLAFYLLSLAFLLNYLWHPRVDWLYLAALSVGVGGLFKEYAFLGAVAIAVVIIASFCRRPLMIVWRGLQTAFLALIPSAIVHLYVFRRFGYTYGDWLNNNEEQYQYASRLIEYIKAGGSLWNFLLLPFTLGLWVLVKNWSRLEWRAKVFVVAAGLSALPIFFWPAITQRILSALLTITIVVAGFAWQRYPKWWPVWFGLLVIYISATFAMDSFLLEAVNLPF